VQLTTNLGMPALHVSLFVKYAHPQLNAANALTHLTPHCKMVCAHASMDILTPPILPVHNAGLFVIYAILLWYVLLVTIHPILI